MATVSGKWLSEEGLTYLWSRLKAIFTKQQETNVIANAGAKNVSLAKFATQTLSKVTFTANPDGTVTATSDGAATGAANLPSTTFLLKAGTYTFTCTETPQRDVTYDSYVYDVTASRTIARDNPNDSPGNVFTLSQDTNVRINCRVAKNHTVSGLIFKPMIRRVEITDSTYQPYAPTNRQLFEAAYRASTMLSDNVDLDTLKTGGIYHGANSVGNSAVHMPVDTGSFNFTLMVIETGDFVIQVFKQLNASGDPHLFIRRFYIYNTSWDAWYSLDSILGVGTQLSSSSNLNDYKAIGVWYTSSASASNSVSNMPVPNNMLGPCRIEVKYVNSSARLLQEVTENVPSGTNAGAIRQFIRAYTASGWGAWHQTMDHNLWNETGSIFTYVDKFTPGIYFLKQAEDVGSGKPVSGRAYAYTVNVFSSTSAVITAYEATGGTPRMYMAQKVSGTWGSWYKFEGTQV